MTKEQMREICEAWYASESGVEVYGDTSGANEDMCVEMEYTNGMVTDVMICTWEELYEVVRERIFYDFTCMTPEEIENYLGSELYNLFCEENNAEIKKALFEEAMARAERMV